MHNLKRHDAGPNPPHDRSPLLRHTWFARNLKYFHETKFFKKPEKP